MLARMIALLLAVVMMTGAAVQVWASSDVVASAGAAVGIDDDVPAAIPAVVAEPVIVPLPDRRDPVSACMPCRDVPGRLHAVFVFRPPRPLASR